MMVLKAPQAGTNSGTSSATHPRSLTQPGLNRAESVLHSATQRLHQSPYRGLRSVELDVSGNTMVLTGQVKTYFLKQMAQHLLGDYSSAWQIKNNLRVA